MRKVLNYLKKYILFFILLIAITVIYFINKDKGQSAINITLSNMIEMLIIIPPIFILIGLLDVWVSKERMIKLIGEGSGIKGNILAIILGSAAAGPLYAAFPIAHMLMRKGATFRNVILFIGAWSTTKIPMIIFEIASMGYKFALMRLAVSMISIFFIAFVIEKSMKKDELDMIYAKAGKTF